MPIVRVALDVPIPTLLDYLAADATQADIGYRVIVPFRGKPAIGIVVEVTHDTQIPNAKLLSCSQILRQSPQLPSAYLELAKFCSNYYQAPIGMALMTGLPPRLRQRQDSTARATGLLGLSQAGIDALAELPNRQKINRRILQMLREKPRTARELAVDANCSLSNIKACKDQGWLVDAEVPRQTPSFLATHALNEEQSSARDAVLAAANQFHCFLLFGITGSGKTEVYLHLIWAALQRNEQALVLVPEIALTPALELLFRHRFPGAVVSIQHSNMPESERANAWLDACDGRADIVVGTRLGVFVPMPRLGLIVVDEEQDPSFKQQEGMKYSARDMAVYRASMEKVPVLLCSATPSLESLHHAMNGRYQLLRLNARAHRLARLPKVGIIDTNASTLREGISQPLHDAIAKRIQLGEQALIFINRRGYAPILACHYCGWVSGCHRCSANMVVHLASKSLRCHYCGIQHPIPRTCPDCGSVEINAMGRGTQRVEAELAGRFPGARILRIDSDTARGGLEDLLESARTGLADILIGTQILAKGHHFERVTLVGILNADAGLFAADYRAPERLFAQLQQVAGRAGRADYPGEVLIQTRYPSHRLYQSLVNNDYETYAKELLADRESAGFPPFVHEAVLRANAPRMQSALEFLDTAINLAPNANHAVTLFDPSPATMAKIDGRQRAQLVVQSPSRPHLQNFLRQWNASLHELRTRVRWHFDIDPVEI